jgi:hypothetical protein
MLSSYLRWAAQKQYVDRILDEPKQPEFDKVEEDEIIRTSFESFKKFKKWNAIFNTLGTFRILIERDLIDMNQDSREEIVKLTEQATRQLAQEVEYEDRQEILNELEDDNAMELNCKRMAVAQYFNKLMRDERNKR